MSRGIKIFLRVALFLALFCACFYVVDKTLQFKYDDGITPMEDFYSYPEDSIDVILLGSSHLGVNIDTTILANQYGIASYKMWGSVQPIWNSYYNLFEALKTQHPKVVVLEALGLSHDVEYYGYVNAIKNTMGLRWSRNKLDAIQTSYEPSDIENALFPLAQYHSRYAELEAKDFSYYFWDDPHSEHNTQNWNVICPMGEPSTTRKTLPLGEKQLKYLKKIIYLCNKNNIPLVVLTAPYTIPDDERARLNTANQLLTEEGVPQLDCLTNYKQYGFDFATDFGDTAGHLNSTGCAKLSSILGEYLTTHYDLPDRTGDPLFSYTLPSDAAYVLGTPFTGNGSTDFVDTKQKLYTGGRDWTIFARFSTQCTSDEKVLFSCFSETEPYRGLLVRLAADDQLDVVVGSNYYTKVDLPQKDWVTLAIAKNGDQYFIYLEGEQVAHVESDCENYDGTLLLGAERMANNTLGRLSAVSIDKFELYNTSKAGAESLQWTEENKLTPSREQQLAALQAQYTGIVPYTLPSRFTGDGASTCVDTGVQLYADPDASWRLTANLVIDEKDGTYLSCFNEEETAYRGLLVRKTQDTFSVQVGSSAQLSTLVYPSAQNELVIEKRGSSYTVSLNGQSLGTVDSPCDAYAGTLLVDAERGYDLQPFRFAALTVSRLTIEPLN